MPPPPAPVTVLIPNFNGRDLLPDAIRSALAQDLPPAEVLVIDDASTDDSPSFAPTLGARVVTQSANRGFASTVNLGVGACATEWIAIVNSDVVLGAGWLSGLLQAATDAGADYACGPLLNAAHPHLLDGGYDLLSLGGCPWRAGNGFPAAALRPPPAAWLPPLTALLIRRTAFLAAGRLDERFGSYLEDVDFALRCLKLGLRGVFVPKATATHRGSATFGTWSPRATRLLSRNQLLLVARHYPSGWPARSARALLAAQLLWGGVACRHGQLLPWLYGKFEALRLWPRFRAQSDPFPLEAFRTHCEAWEHEIRAWQGKPPRDVYWRWYFRLAGS